jgi:hypothetical protein
MEKRNSACFRKINESTGKEENCSPAKVSGYTNTTPFDHRPELTIIKKRNDKPRRGLILQTLYHTVHDNRATKETLDALVHRRRREKAIHARRRPPDENVHWSTRPRDPPRANRTRPLNHILYDPNSSNYYTYTGPSLPYPCAKYQ